MTHGDLDELLKAWGRWGATTASAYPRVSAIARLTEPFNDQPPGCTVPIDCPADVAELMAIVSDIARVSTYQRPMAAIRARYWYPHIEIKERAAVLGISTARYHADCQRGFDALLFWYRGLAHQRQVR